MKKGKVRKIVILIIVACMILTVLGCVAWKKRLGIYNTYMKMTGREPSRTTQWVLKGKEIGYHKQVIKTGKNKSETLQIADNGSNMEKVESTITQEASWVDTSLEVDQQLEEEQKNGYTWEEPLIVQNPYRYSPLTAVILFDTDEECEVRVTVKGKTEAADIEGTIDAATSHRVPVVGLYAGQENTVLLELLDDAGKVTDSQEVKITTDELPEKMSNAVTPVKTSGESALPLTIVHGQGARYPYAYDCMGDVRWYLDRKSDKFGIYPLSNDRFLFAAGDIGITNIGRPDTSDLYEADYLGRAYKLYYIQQGVHHDIAEKEPGGNLLILSNSGEEYYWDMIQEIDRKTGEVVDELKLSDIFKKQYVSSIDWAHINTISYQASDDTILISPRNLSAAVKIKWSAKEIVWMLGDPNLWKGTEFEQYVLQPEDDFVYQFYQHSVYQLTADLDGNPETQEISMFDNHASFFKNRIKDIYDNPNESYVLVYSVNEKDKTVKQIKKIPVAYSQITSNTCYDETSGHIFGMCGYIKGGSGINYEMDYETGEIINQYQISSWFYRSTPMKIDYNDLASAMETDENYICGELLKPVETTKKLTKTTDQMPDESEVSMRLMDRILYVKSDYHAISQIIFSGEDHTYVYDLSDKLIFSKKMMLVNQEMAVPLMDMSADSYDVYVVYKDEFYNSGQTITIKQ